MKDWRLIISKGLNGSENMAVDEAIMCAVREKKAPPTIRFYDWNPPTLSIGAFQRVGREVDLERCKQLGIGFVRRPTGGRAVLHDDEVTYSFIVNEGHPLIPKSIRESFQIAAGAIVEGLRFLGVPAGIAGRDSRIDSSAQRPGTGHAPACFDSSSWYEIAVGDKKLVGSAQRREDGMLLQHGSILIGIDIKKLLSILRFSSEKRYELSLEILERHTTTISESLGRDVSFDEVAYALTQGFSRKLGCGLNHETLSSYEKDLAAKLAVDKYGSDEWLFRK